MSNPSVCSVCVAAKEKNIAVDTGKSKTFYADLLGVSEASVRRHFKHGPEPRLVAPKKEKVVSISGNKPEYRETWTGSQGEMSVVIQGEQITNEAILRKFGHDPEKVSIIGTMAESHWLTGGVWNHSYKFETSRRSAEDSDGVDLTISDLPLLYNQISTRKIQSYPTLSTNKSLVVVWADIQVGKTGSRGGTPELIQRIKEKRAALQNYMEDNPTDSAYFLSVGDEVESFENTPQQSFTNDLSFPDQLDLELTFELDLITDLAKLHKNVTVSGCSSNHCRWRSGKNVLGAPSDDYGLYLKHQLEKALRLNSDYDGVKFVYPEKWDETVAVDVQGTKIGLAHGHQVNRPDGIEAWWTKQTFGAQATAEADILLTGHFHTFRAQPMGRGIKSGKNRWWIQAPTLDNGSDWFRNLQGSDSDAGMLVFMVDEHGLDLQSLTIL